jgi:acyl-CoA synthetase (AMP-forming)/AMP-acid ligase II
LIDDVAGARQTSFPDFRPTSGELIKRAAAKHGSKTLVVLEKDRLTYAEAEARSAELARGMLASGLGKGSRVGLLAPNGPDWIVGWLAASRIGAVAALLNTYYRERELGWVLRHSDVQALLMVDRHLGHDYLERLERAVPGLADQEAERILVPSHPFLRSVWVWGDGGRGWSGRVDDLAGRAGAVSEELFAEVEAEVDPADPMVLVYSSGSTADPKAAIHSHGAAVRHAHNLNQFRDLNGDDVLYTAMPLFWVGGFSYSLISAMHLGATLVFDERFEPGSTLDLIEREGVTQVAGWPHMAQALNKHPSFPERKLKVRDGSLIGPNPTPEEAAAFAKRANSLGMTETLGPHTAEDRRDPPPPDKLDSFGRAVPGVEHRIVDPVTLEPRAPGEMGELWIRGYSVMQGLHKKERSEVFTPDGWYRTGDGGWFDEDGYLWFKGRMGDQIKSAGMNITPREVELVLEDLPEVAMAIVSGIPAGERGEDVVAAVVLKPGATADEASLRAAVKAEIASYKVPRHIAVFADQSELPWLDSGKIDRRKVTTILDERFGER